MPARYPLNYSASVGKYDKYLYFFIQVIDNQVVMRDVNALSISKNDHLELAFTTPTGEFQRFILSNKQAGWLDAFSN